MKFRAVLNRFKLSRDVNFQFAAKRNTIPWNDVLYTMLALECWMTLEHWITAEKTHSPALIDGQSTTLGLFIHK